MEERTSNMLDKILKTLTSPPTFCYPYFCCPDCLPKLPRYFIPPFILHVDASSKGFGCNLYQKIGDHIKILGFGSKTFNKAEQKYHKSELELLALKWVATGQHFGDYLVYDPLGDVYTDNNPWVYFFLTAKRNATGHRWKNKLADSNSNLHYARRGKTSIDVDFFSKFPRDIHQYTNTSTKEDTDKAVNSVVNQLDNTEAWLCSVNTVNNLQKEEQQLKQGTTLKQITQMLCTGLCSEQVRKGNSREAIQ